MGCGWLPSADASAVWSGPNGKLELTVCPGYTTELPDVIDIAQQFWWADRGGLQRNQIARNVSHGIDILRSGVNEAEAYAMERIKERK